MPTQFARRFTRQLLNYSAIVTLVSLVACGDDLATSPIASPSPAPRFAVVPDDPETPTQDDIDAQNAEVVNLTLQASRLTLDDPSSTSDFTAFSLIGGCDFLDREEDCLLRCREARDAFARGELIFKQGSFDYWGSWTEWWGYTGFGTEVRRLAVAQMTDGLRQMVAARNSYTANVCNVFG